MLEVFAETAVWSSSFSWQSVAPARLLATLGHLKVELRTLSACALISHTRSWRTGALTQVRATDTGTRDACGPVTKARGRLLGRRRNVRRLERLGRGGDNERDGDP